MAYPSYILLLVVVLFTSPGYTMDLPIYWTLEGISTFMETLQSGETQEHTIEVVSAVPRVLYKVSEPEYRQCLYWGGEESWVLQANMPQVVQLQEGLNYFISQPQSLCWQGYKMALRVTKMIQPAGYGSNQNYPTPRPSATWTLKPWASYFCFSLIFYCAVVLI
ncbi:hypothetical protein COCNU_06G015270 [Cocos nucifera]|uniref:Uncharacterized protein n=1 Tax=Cocos nucifera TaxID=13894 RepID=A0A8K0ICC5_COCNU|nr:hypothetical protein COCNU_06G015270 [Cocos nucifera]